MNWPIDPRNGKPMILGPVELEVLEAVKGRSITVRDLENGKAYTTNMTTLDRLFKKGMLRREMVGRAFVYSALLLLLLASPLSAQINPLQVKLCPGGSQPCAFDKPLTEGSLRAIVEMGTCTALGCNTVSDSQNNIWKVAAIAPNYNGTALQYSIGGPAGQDTVFFTSGTGWLAIIAEYPPATALDSVSTGTYSFDNKLAGDPNGGSSDVNWAHPLLLTEPCELVIGWAFHGSFGGPWIATAGPGFTMRAQVDGALALEDSVALTPGVIVASMTWNDYAHWDMGSAAFKTGHPCGN